MWSVLEAAAGFLLPSSFVFLVLHCFEPGSAQILGEVACLTSTPRGTSFAFSTCTPRVVCGERGVRGQTNQAGRKIEGVVSTGAEEESPSENKRGAVRYS